MELPFDNTQNVQRLRYEAFSIFATEINHCNDYGSIAAILAGQVKFIMDFFVFRVYFQFENACLTFNVHRGNCTIQSGSADGVTQFDHHSVSHSLPAILTREDIDNNDLLNQTIYNNSKICKLLVLPGKNNGYAISITNAIHKDKPSFESDFKFLRLIGDLLGSKLHQLSLIEIIAGKSLQLELKNIEITNLNATLEDRVTLRTHELKQANHELQSLFYAATHDFRTPITNILGLVNVSEMYTQDQDVLSLFDGCRKAVLNLDRTLRKLNSMAYYSDFDKEPEEVRLIYIINEVSEKLRNDFIEKKVSVNVTGDSDSIILSHKAMICSIFENLIENAIVFCRKDPEIEVKIFSVFSDLVIHFSDNGIGITEAIREKIFDMFYRGSELSTGSGLGLFVVKKFLKNLNGSITFESLATAGTVFKIQLPCLQPVATPIAFHYQQTAFV